MKSEHRHELETNWLAHHVAIWLDRLQPYNSLIVGGLLAAAIALFAFSYFGGETSSRQSAAWNSYNEAVAGGLPNLETLRQSAADYPDSPMQEYADITWADGQVWLASRYYMQNRTAAKEALNLAIGAYQGLLKESDNERLASRAHFGMARAYEIQGELEKAREEYGKVKGGFALLAEQRAKDLAESRVKDAYGWLVTAQAPQRTSPIGPGTPGLQPSFAPGDVALPAETTSTDEASESSAATIDQLFEGLGDSPTDNANVTTEGAGQDAAKSDTAPAADAKAE